MRRIAAGLLLVVAAAGQALAHPGGLNAEGCHNNRKTGDYHCHRPSAGAASSGGDRARAKGALGATRPGAFPNCAAARAAGAAPVRRGEPGYGPHLDRDGDGVGCEPYRGR
ncbi:excalibur calcium-binding domain-containing protein [Phenylobacterium sp.]|uniref:excalibur calcium-binding domain-containing protein n=1 Tax=Phenylobacterium sp. TaxID=1871053 RepID=UPI002FE29A77